MTWTRGVPLPFSQAKEAPPVVTGRIDSRTVMAVFRGWAGDADMQMRFNPWLELERALMLRNECVAVWLVEPHQLAGRPAEERARSAQDFLIFSLADRGWRREMVEAYLDADLAADDWRHVI